MSSLKNFKYSRLSKFLHRLMFISTDISKIFFEIEKQIFLKKINNSKISSFFITGLPRSGSTILLNSLHKTNYFSSLQYSDMPFITSPNLWSKLNFFKEINKTHERAHKDGIRIGFNSPEAFEEVFWKSQLSFKNKDPLIFDASDYTNKVIKNFENFVKLISFKNRKKFYLSKNNNNILRLNSLLNYFPNSIFIFVIRDPSSHVISLQNMHKKFKELQKNDPFILNYMNYLGHHEFGSGHKVFDFSNSQDDIKKDDENINYWLNIWINYYEYLEKYLINNNIYLLDYSKFCNNQNKYIEFFVKKKIENYNIKNFIKKTDSKKNYGKLDDSLLNKANILYEKLITDYSV